MGISRKKRKKKKLPSSSPTNPPFRNMTSIFLQAKRLCNVSLRLLSTTNCRTVRRIIVEEEGKTINIKGVKEDSPRTKNVIDSSMFSASGSCDAYENCHPLCKFDKVHEIKHTDVLILEQFVDSNGDLMPRDLTGLCERQNYRLNKLVGMAQKAGLMDSKDKFKMEKVTKPWAKYNSYWDEKSIDAQWHEFIKRKNRAKYRGT